MNIKTIKDDCIEIKNENNELFFSVEEILEKNFVELKVNGELKNDVVLELEDEVMALLVMGKSIKLNFENLKYIGSSAMAMLLSLQRFCDQKDNIDILLKKIPQQIMEEFIEVGFHEILNIEGMEEQQ